MSKHTPGPWNYKSPLEVVGSDGTTIKLIGLTHAQYETDEANARLIAAAPELLEALQLLSASLPLNHKVDSKVVAKCRSAIAKAKGES